MSQSYLLQRLGKGDCRGPSLDSDPKSAYWVVKAEALQMLAQPVSIDTVRNQQKDGQPYIRLDELEHACGLMADLANALLKTDCSI